MTQILTNNACLKLVFLHSQQNIIMSQSVCHQRTDIETTACLHPSFSACWKNSQAPPNCVSVT